MERSVEFPPQSGRVFGGPVPLSDRRNSCIFAQRRSATRQYVCDLTHDHKRGQVTCFPVREEWKDRFSLVPEDYLHGVITVINELVRAHPSSP